VSRAAVEVVNLAEVEPIELPQGSWSRMLAKGERSSLGYSVFTPGAELAAVCHETEEVAYVVAGSGELRLDDGAVSFREGDAMRIAPGVWHAVVNTGDEDVVMVFGFPHPDYPPTQRR
jgi:quercetin dioxygenase-like cupin family protein